MSEMTHNHVMRAALMTRNKAAEMLPGMPDPWLSHFNFYLERHTTDEMFRVVASSGCQGFRRDGSMCLGPDVEDLPVCVTCGAVRKVVELNRVEEDVRRRLHAAGFDPFGAPFDADGMPRPPQTVARAPLGPVEGEPTDAS